MNRVLFFWGGWEGHQPEKIVHLFAAKAEALGFNSDIQPSLDCLDDLEHLKTYHVIFPCWTMGMLSAAQSGNLCGAVRSGVGLAGIHGGMGDAFRGNLEYEWITGGHFVGHPYIGEYMVRIRDRANPITAGLPEAFPYSSEQYYMMVDPGIHVLADTEYEHEGHRVTMPVAWIRTWGKGRVFYSALGHDPKEFEEFPAALRLTMQGMLWVAGVSAAV